MLTELRKITQENSVLVHSGLTAVGRAAIHVCLEKKCQLFVTVSDSKQMELLRKTFPSVCERASTMSAPYPHVVIVTVNIVNTTRVTAAAI